jgi:phosphopentomutase
MPESPARESQRRAIVLIIDGFGVGAAPDAAEFGDESTSNTLANVSAAVNGLELPNLAKLGLANLTPIAGTAPVDQPVGFFGKLQEASRGKDTQTGHWEMMGLVSEKAFPLYPQGFPPEVLERFIKETGCKGILCNKPVSGTVVLEELGEEHQKTGFPIVYTSGDSVFQIACHADTVPLEKQYEWCRIARRILDGRHRVGRVICRPFTGTPGNYKRLGGDRRDYSVPPPGKTLLDGLCARGDGVLGIGKIEDIFDRQGLTHAVHTGSNRQGLELTLAALRRELDLVPLAIVEDAPACVQLIFTNLVDTDMLFGHRRDVRGYAGALVEIDEWLATIVEAMGPDDALIISSDHGNDPTARGTDHTREFVPVLAYSPGIKSPADYGPNLGTRDGFVDVAASLAVWLGVKWDGPGVSFIPELSKAATR